MEKFVRDRGVVAVKTVRPPHDTRIDEASATVTYIGDAPAGTSVASALWRIKKIDTSSGTVITFADSDPNYTKVWNDRATYTY